ncbi:trigger factor [Thermosipho ferrireducens]|uniref:Trigger factor n=1 Tax=Thermosipho ferrireducens TaxID=2571116 RepID=A0ABX7S801_9BACT|nr:trigger factor [Thermosipho ferrireducens]QTA38711.1 trigger factor [Thermosipho ferrireducens]
MDIKELGIDKNVVTKEYVFSKQEIEIAERRVTNELNQKYTIEGFRRGRVPKSVFKTRFGKSFYEIFVFEKLIDNIYNSVKGENLLLVPEIAESTVNADEAKIVVYLHKKPEITIDYEKIKVKVTNKEQVLDNYVEFRLKTFQEENAILEPKDGEADYEDLVKVKVTILSNDTGKELIKEKEDEYVLYKDDERPIVTNVVGHKKGDIVEFDREFDVSEEGKKLSYHYKIEILEIYNRNLPEITDEFVKTTLSEMHLETVEALKNKLREEGEQIYESETKQSIREQILSLLPDATELDISEKTIDYAVRLIVANMKEENSFENFVKKYNNEEEALKELKEYYLHDLKKELALDKIAKENEIKKEVTDEELDSYAEILAPYWGISVERAKVLVKERADIRKEVENTIFVDKILDVIAEKVEKEVVDVDKDNKEGEENEKEQ